MRNFSRKDDGTFAVVLYLKPDERKQLKQLADSLGMNDFEALKYAMKLVFWWSRNKIEPEE